MPEVLIGFDFPEDVILGMGEEGVILKLNDYINKWAYYFPQQMEKLKNKMAMQWMHSADGNIYYLPWIQEQLGNNYALRGWINKKWLDKLGLEMPVTTEDFFEVMQAFAAMDPNGNGKKDEIPCAGDTEVPRGKIVDFLMNAFIYSDSRDRLILDENGKVDVIYNKDEYREGLRFAAKLMKSGLMLDQSFTIDVRSLRGIIESGEVSTVGFFVAGIAGAISPNNKRRLEYVPMPPLTGPKGVNYAAYFPEIPSKRFVITKDAKNPEAIFRWGDLMCSEEASIRARFGVPDKDFRKPLPDEKSMYDSIGMPAVLAQILPWGATQNSHWSTVHAGILPLGICDGQVAPDNPLDNERWVAASVPLFLGRESPNRVEHVIFSNSEMTELMDLKNSINSYVNEYQALFTVGQKNIDQDWDTYVKELNRIGLKKYLDITQRGYNRAMGINSP
jgi:putative aldouronate transport system substrate-binding protein